MLHVLAPEKRRVKPGALLDLVVIGKIARMLTIYLSVLWILADRRRVSNWSTLEKKSLGFSSP